MAGRRIRDAADARACLKAAAASGLSRIDWAHEEGVDGRSLNAWGINLGRRRKVAEPPPATRLVELVPALKSPPRSACYVVRCGRLAVEVDEHFDEATLHRLLSVVAAC